MDFNLTDEQVAFQNMVKDFTEREIETIAVHIDRSCILPDDLIGKMAQVGLLGMTVPKKYGGSEVSKLDCILACEQIAYSGTGAWWLTGFNNSIPDCIAHYGSEELRRKYLPALCDGTAYASIQFTEEHTGSDPAVLTTEVMIDRDSYVINGMKRFSTFGARDGYAVVYAKDENGECTAFIVQKNIKGYVTNKLWELMGGGGIETVDVFYDNVRVSGDSLLGEKGKAYEILLYWIALEKVQQAAANVGMAQAALDEAVKYAKMRMVRGKTISDMQGIRWMLADMHAKIAASRLLTYRAAFLQDQQSSDWQAEAAATKLFVVPATMEVVEMARRIHGAYGYTRDLKIDRLYRAISGATGIGTTLEINKSIVGNWIVRK